MNRWWSLVALVIPVLIISMDATILGFAIPKLSAALEPSSSELLWIIDVYSFVLAGLLVTMGIVGDRVGRRRLLLLGSAGFSAASIAAAFSPNTATLIAARALLGVAGATLMPSTLAMIRNIFTDTRERQLAIALWAVSFSAGAAIGPLLGGLLLDHYWWGSVFLVGAPFTGVLLVVGPRLLPESKDPDPQPFDIPSVGLSMVAMFPFVYAIKSIAEHGPSGVAWIALAVGVGGGAAFLRRQRHLAEPMIDVEIFRVPRVAMAMSGNLVACFGFSGAAYFATQYLQLVLDMSALRASIQLVPSVLGTIAITMLAPSAARAIGTFRVIALGLAGGAVGFGIMTQIGVDSSPAVITLAMLVLNGGLSATMAVSVDGIVAALPADRAGAGASISETGNELGIALGTAILGSVAAAVYRGDIATTPNVPAAAVEHARETLGAAHSTALDLGGDLGARLINAANSAFVAGTHTAATVAVVLMAMLSSWAAYTSINLRRQPIESATTPTDANKMASS